MLSHGNLAWTATVATRCPAPRPATSSSRTCRSRTSPSRSSPSTATSPRATQLYFAESIEKVPDNLKEVQPTVFFGVPRIWEKLHAGIAGKLAAGAAGAPLHRRRRDAHRQGVPRREERGAHAAPAARGRARPGRQAGVLEGKQAVGLGRARHCVSGAAPIAPGVLEFFAGLDVVVYEVYGQSEGTGPTSITRAGNNRVGTVGPPFPGVEVRFGGDGEILVRGPNVFLGYFKDPQATAETLVDGWLCSGDLGKLDEDGNLLITGRKKEIIITAGGKNITPKNIESALKEHPLIAEAVVIGDRRKYLTALLILDPEAAERFAREKARRPASEVQAEVQRAVDEVNTHFARVETVKKFHLLPQPFSIDGGELTPTLKVKRRVVYERYAREIDAMYEGDWD